MRYSRESNLKKESVKEINDIKLELAKYYKDS